MTRTIGAARRSGGPLDRTRQDKTSAPAPTDVGLRPGRRDSDKQSPGTPVKRPIGSTSPNRRSSAPRAIRSTRRFDGPPRNELSAAIMAGSARAKLVHEQIACD